MLKKIIILVFIFLSLFTINIVSSCSVGSSLDGCLNETNLVPPNNNVVIEDGFKDKLLYWIKNIAGFLGLIAIGAIVWGGFMMVFSTGEEEKIKKAKDMVKWAILGFLGIVLASSLISLVVNFMYSL